MLPDHSTHRSHWLKRSPLQPKYPQLVGRAQTEIVVLGGGIAGLSTALELLERGHQVTVLEALVIGGGTTGGSTGHLDSHPESGPHKFIHDVGLDNARAVVAARQAAIELIAERADKPTEFVRIPAYYYTNHAGAPQTGQPAPRCSSREEMQAELTAALQLGMDASWLDEVPLPQAGFGYRIPSMARMNSLAYVQHLANLVTERGGQIYEQSIASGPLGKHPTEIEVGEATIEFERAVCAVHSNYTEVMRIYFQTPAYQSYAVCVRVADPPPDALFWDNSDPYYYTRHVSSADPQLLIVGGCDQRTGAHDSNEAQRGLLDYVNSRFKVLEVVDQWSAELFEPVDKLPIIGLAPGKDNVWVITGLSGVGLTWGTAAGRIVAEQIAGVETPLHSVVCPSRWAVHSLPAMIGEQATAAADYAERILPAERIDPEQLSPGQGKVGVSDGKHIAACRDRQGALHVRKPLCTHMGGVVHWNEAEQTWDCPVHGGRFCAHGQRLYGPPEDDLE